MGEANVKGEESKVKVNEESKDENVPTMTVIEESTQPNESSEAKTVEVKPAEEKESKAEMNEEAKDDEVPTLVAAD